MLKSTTPRRLALAVVAVSATLALSPLFTGAQSASGSKAASSVSASASTARKLIDETANSLALLDTPVPSFKLEQISLRELANMAAQPLGLGVVVGTGVDEDKLLGPFDLPNGSITHAGLLALLAGESDCKWHLSGKTLYVTGEDARPPVAQIIQTSDVMDILTALGQREAALRKAVDPEHLPALRNRKKTESGEEEAPSPWAVSGIVDDCVRRLDASISDSVPELGWEGSGMVTIGPDGLLVARLRPQGHVALESLLASIRASLALK